MKRLNTLSIDIAKNPAQAIQNISDPILEVLNAKVEEYEVELKDNNAKKKQFQV